jgi:2-polyprenyl-6-methoxyphenol hydroxylase-like FAD-dependent oxidoreductase
MGPVGERRVLISGAGIAGPALAWWLSRAGWSTTVVERFDGPREAGQNVDVRGAAREVLRRMDLEDAVRAAGTGELGLAVVDAHGSRLAEFAAGTDDFAGATAELEILRADLNALLLDRTDVEYLFGDSIAAIDGGRVSFARGSDREFDVVVVAEGLTSRTRGLVLPDVEITDFGIHVAYLTIPRTPADDDWWRSYTAPGGRVVWLRPDNHGTIRAGLAVRSGVRGLEDLGRDDQVRILRRTFAGAGWETDRVLAALDDAPFVLDTLGQARLPRWSTGRVALLGDAAYCASPLSGMGTSLALVGAYVLAGALSRADPPVAFSRYEQLMRPYVEQAQRLQPGVLSLSYPRTRAALKVQQAVFRAAGSRPARKLAELAMRRLGSPADAFELPPPP